MQYRYEVDDRDDSDLASGRVLYNLPGAPAFPVRLMCELFERGLAARRTAAGGQAGGQAGWPAVVYDPCCGAAYHLAALGFRRRADLAGLYASEIDPRAAAAARRNLGLLTPVGLAQRAGELDALYASYGKESHRLALESAWRLAAEQAGWSGPALELGVFQADLGDLAAQSAALSGALGARRVDLLFADVPYGQHSRWLGNLGVQPAGGPLAALLAAAAAVLPPGGAAVIVSDKRQAGFQKEDFRRGQPAGLEQVEHLKIGHRQAEILRRTGG